MYTLQHLPAQRDTAGKSKYFSFYKVELSGGIHGQ